MLPHPPRSTDQTPVRRTSSKDYPNRRSPSGPDPVRGCDNDSCGSPSWWVAWGRAVVSASVACAVPMHQGPSATAWLSLAWSCRRVSRCSRTQVRAGHLALQALQRGALLCLLTHGRLTPACVPEAGGGAGAAPGGRRGEVTGPPRGAGLPRTRSRDRRGTPRAPGRGAETHGHTGRPAPRRRGARHRP